MDESGKKSAGKSAPGIPFLPGDDPRRGNGPAPGAPNAGRPKSAFRALARERSEDLLADLMAIAKNPEEKTADRIRAIEVIGRWAGVEKLELGLDDEGDSAAAWGFVVFPPLDPRPSLEDAGSNGS